MVLDANYGHKDAEAEVQVKNVFCQPCLDKHYEFMW